MIENRAKEERRLSEIARSNARDRLEALRAEVERLKALLCDNHMTKDPFKHFGDRSQISPTPTFMSEKDRTIASMSPALASTQCGSRPLTSLSMTRGGSPIYEKNIFLHTF